MERVMIFIDGSNLYNRLVELYAAMFADYQSFRMDFEKSTKLLCGGNRRLVHTHYYGVRVRQADDPVGYARQQKFFSYLRSGPIYWYTWVRSCGESETSTAQNVARLSPMDMELRRA